MRSVTRVLRLVLCTVIPATVPMVAAAQSIRGMAVDLGGVPVPGAIVMLVDGRDSVHSRALTNERGEFLVFASSAGVYRLRTLRIGFRPTTSTGIALGSGQETAHRLELSGVPLVLDTVRVVDRGSCRVSTDSAAATFTIWEQVRAALTATQLSEGSRGINATIMMFERTLEPQRERVQNQRSWIRSQIGKGIWISASPDSLRKIGYIASNSDGSTTYFAPDLRVLLSDAFIEDHCFRLASSRDPRLIGIAFEPTRERRRIPGIRGTLWLERRSAELRRMEFRYTNATREQEFGDAGGQMGFARVKSGAWVISAWNIRMPLLELREARVGSVAASGIVRGATTRELHVRAIRVEGGEVALVTQHGDTLWARPPMPLTGVVTDSGTGARVTAAQVTLRGTALSAITDSAGRFRVPHLLPGQYLIDVRTPELTRFGIVHSIPLTFTDSTAPLSIRVPSAKQAAESLCPAAGGATIAGTVQYGNDTTPARDVKVVAQWNDKTPTGSRWGGMETTSDRRGGFRFCRIPHGITVGVSSSTDSSASGRIEVRIPETAGFAHVELVLAPLLQRGGTLTGVVRGEENAQFLADVEVAIPEAGLRVSTNERGAFRIDNIPPGERLVTIRRVGYAPRTDTISFTSRRTVEKSILLSRVPTLDTVSVTENVVIPSFEEHRRLGRGHFLTRADLEKLQGRPIASAIGQVTNARVIYGRSGQGWVLSTRGPTNMSLNSSGTPDWMWCPKSEMDRMRGLACGCYAQVYLDKSLMNRGRPSEPFDVNQINSESIEAVEWYASKTQVPVELTDLSTECGVLVIHSRRSK